MEKEAILQQSPESSGASTQGKVKQSGRIWSRLAAMFGTYGLLILLILLIIFFSIIQPDTFPTQLTMESILSTAAINALASLAQMVAASVWQLDLSIGYMIGLTSILAVALQTRTGLPWGLVILIVLLIGVLMGLINGLLVHVAKI